VATGQHGALNKDAGSTSLADHRNCEAARPLGAACFVVVRRGVRFCLRCPYGPISSPSMGPPDRVCASITKFDRGRLNM